MESRECLNGMIEDQRELQSEHSWVVGERELGASPIEEDRALFARQTTSVNWGAVLSLDWLVPEDVSIHHTRGLGRERGREGSNKQIYRGGHCC